MSQPDVQLDLSLNYSAEAAEYAEVQKQRTFWKNVFKNATTSAYRNGLGKEYLRCFKDIQDKLDKVVATSEDERSSTKLMLSLTPQEFAFFSEAFNKATWTPESHPLICQIYDILDAAAAKK